MSNEKNLLDYVDSKCFDRHQLEFKIIKYEINNECYDSFVWKNIDSSNIINFLNSYEIHEDAKLVRPHFS